MSAASWLVIGALLHLTLAAATALALSRVETYTSPQRALQAALALLVPVLGTIIVLVMVKEAMAEPPKPDTSRFDRDPYGGG